MIVAFALIVGGFLVKAAIVPFHFWLADAYAVAPTPAVIVFTGVMSDLGIYAVARIYWTVFQGPLGPHADGIRVVLVGFAVLTALLGAVMCLFQAHLKRLLAFATISQVGLAMIGVALLTPSGLAGAALLIPADGLLRAGLFVCLGILIHRCASVHELHLHGQGGRVPRLVAGLFIAGAVGLAAAPGLGAFAGKSLVEDAAGDVGYGWVIGVFVVATVLTSGALLRAAGRIFLGRGVGAAAVDPEQRGERVRGGGRLHAQRRPGQRDAADRRRPGPRPTSRARPRGAGRGRALRGPVPLRRRCARARPAAGAACRASGDRSGFRSHSAC